MKDMSSTSLLTGIQVNPACRMDEFKYDRWGTLVFIQQPSY
jgi:hypothetical protein